MKLRTMMLTGGLSAAVLLAPLATATSASASASASADEDTTSVKITSVKLVKDNLVVQGAYTCDAPFKARFIEVEGEQFQGEDGEDEVRALKALVDRPCTGTKRQFQATLKPRRDAKFLPTAKGGGAVYVQVEVILTNEANILEDQAGDGGDFEV